MILVSFPFKIAVTISLLIISIKIIFTRFTDIYVDFNNLIFKVFSFSPVLFVFSDDKTEEATPHKKKKAKEEGNVAKSTFLVSAISILGVVGVIILGKFILRELKK